MESVSVARVGAEVVFEDLLSFVLSEGRVGIGNRGSERAGNDDVGGRHGKEDAADGHRRLEDQL